MLKKGIIESVFDDKAIVRIPNIDKSLSAVANIPDSDLTPSPISTLPGIQPKLQAGDVVIIGFEDDNFSKPIILGTLLSRATSSVCNITVDSLTTNGKSNLNQDTFIGNISPTNIESLAGYNTQLGTDIQNINITINQLTERIKELESKIKNLQ